MAPVPLSSRPVAGSERTAAYQTDPLRLIRTGKLRPVSFCHVQSRAISSRMQAGVWL